MTEPSTKTTAEMNDLLGCLDKGAEYRHATGEYSAFIVQLEQAYPTLRDHIRTLEAKLEASEAQNKKLREALQEIVSAPGRVVQTGEDLYEWTGRTIARNTLSSLPTL